MEIPVYKDGIPCPGYTCDPETGKVYSYKRSGHGSNIGIEYKKVIGAPNKDGYIHCSLGLIHRLIWESVYGPIPDGLQVNHINEVKTDNRICNLNLMTPEENTNWGTRNARVAEKMKGKQNAKGPHPSMKGNKNAKGNKGRGCSLRQRYPDTMEVVAEWTSSHKAAEGNPGFDQTAICAASKGEYCGGHIYKGFYWELVP